MGWDYRPLPARPVHLVLEATPLLLLATNLLTATDQTAVPPSLSPRTGTEQNMYSVNICRLT